MKKLLLAITSLFLVTLGGLWSADDAPTLTLKLLDDRGEPCTGIVRIQIDGAGDYLQLSPLLPRMIGLTKGELGLGWHVVPTKGAAVQVPAGKTYRIEALAGLETKKVAHVAVHNRSTEIEIKLPSLFDPATRDLVAANTHLHLKSLTLEQADDYVKQIPAADQLRVLFLSYLERYKDDLTYITNKYPIGDLPKLSGKALLVNNGEEHRHNLEGFGQGFGHVMLLNIKSLVQPVSIGPGITGKGFDEPSLRPGIDDAKKQGGTIIWCHNSNGYEDVLMAISGRLDAMNVFDGSRLGTFEENYYKYLNLGIRLPISTGTDWFQYDFSRVYAEVKGPLTIPAWLEALKKGRNVATNGPLLHLRVQGQSPGSVLNFDTPTRVTIDVEGIGRDDFEKLVLIRNGKAIASAPAKMNDGYRASIKHDLIVDGPSWFAARIETTNKNDLDRPLFAHTSPVYADYAGKRVFIVDDALELIKQVEEGRATLDAKGKFSSEESRRSVLMPYDAAIADLRMRINERGAKK